MFGYHWEPDWIPNAVLVGGTNQVKRVNAILANGNEDFHHVETSMNYSAVTSPCKGMRDQEAINMVEW